MLALRVQRIQPNPQTGPLILDKGMKEVMLPLQRLIRATVLRSNPGNATQSRYNITQDLIFRFDLQSIASKRPSRRMFEPMQRGGQDLIFQLPRRGRVGRAEVLEYLQTEKNDAEVQFPR